MFNSITIEKEVSYMGRRDIYTIKQGDKSIPITHKVGGFMHKKEKAETKKLTHTYKRDEEFVFYRKDR